MVLFSPGLGFTAFIFTLWFSKAWRYGDDFDFVNTAGQDKAGWEQRKNEPQKKGTKKKEENDKKNGKLLKKGSGLDEGDF